MKKGFTLMELIIVIIILGVLATIGFTQYQRVVEKGRTSEAKTVLGQLRSAQEAYRLEHEQYADDMADLGVNAPDTCVATHYFSYSVTSGGAGFTVQADRCPAGSGKNPGADNPYLIILDETGTWDGTQGYY